MFAMFGTLYPYAITRGPNNPGTNSMPLIANRLQRGAFILDVR